MRLLAIALSVCTSLAQVRQESGWTLQQITHGPNSPTIYHVSGNVTVTYITHGCPVDSTFPEYLTASDTQSVAAPLPAFTSNLGLQSAATPSLAILDSSSILLARGTQIDAAGGIRGLGASTTFDDLLAATKGSHDVESSPLIPAGLDGRVGTTPGALPPYSESIAVKEILGFTSESRDLLASAAMISSTTEQHLLSSTAMGTGDIESISTPRVVLLAAMDGTVAATDLSTVTFGGKWLPDSPPGILGLSAPARTEVAQSQSLQLTKSDLGLSEPESPLSFADSGKTLDISVVSRTVGTVAGEDIDSLSRSVSELVSAGQSITGWVLTYVTRKSDSVAQGAWYEGRQK